METVNALVYRCSGHKSELVECFNDSTDAKWSLRFKDRFPELSSRSVAQQSAEILHTDVAIFYFSFDTEQSERIALRHLKAFIDQLPYVPVVVVGGPRRRLEYFRKLGAARYLSASTPFHVVAREALRAHRATWWWAVRAFEVPTFVVNERLEVIRANAATRTRFGDEVLGKVYSEYIEAAGELSPDHPIREAFSRRTGVSKYLEPVIGRFRRANVVCTPIPGLKNQVRAVAIQLFEVNWPDVFTAASSFLQVDDPQVLYRLIVEKVAELGFTRARLYEYDEQDRRLYGRQSIGLSEGKARQFASGFYIPVEQDPPSSDIVAEKRALPFLCIYGCDRQTKCSVDRLVRRYEGEPLYQDELERKGVYRWIEVPLIIPAVDPAGRSTTRLWGKLSIDRGLESDTLDAGDVTNLSMVAVLASSAVAAALGTQEERRHLKLYRQYSERMAKELSTSGSRKKILPRIRSVLLELFLEITGADVAFYRDLRRKSLRLEGELWRLGVDHSQMEIPPQKLPGEGVSSRIFERLRDDGRLRKGDDESVRAPFFEPDARKTTLPMLQSRTGLPTNQTNFIKFIGSELCLPLIVKRDRCRGVIVAVSNRPGRFQTELVSKLRHFLYMANQWIELGERLDEQKWWDKVLRDIIDVLPMIAAAKTDEQLHACIAAVLSAHSGLCWNCVRIFRTNTSVPGTADLVYAIGGLGHTEDERKAHGRLQRGVEKDFPTLRSLLEYTLRNPVPGTPMDDGTIDLDELYRLCVQDADKPIQILGGPFVQGAPIDVDDPKSVSNAHPLAWLFEGKMPAEQIPLKLSLEGWLQQLNRERPGIFSAETTYAYPLWSECHDHEEPLGVILVDMAYMPEKDLEMVISATRIVLDLVADILSIRERVLRERGRLGWFMSLNHAPKLSDTWQALRAQILKKVPMDADETKAIHEYAELVDKAIERQNKAFYAQFQPHQRIEDLGMYLEEYQERINDGQNADGANGSGPTIRLDGNWTAVTGIPLGFDRKLLDDVFGCLLSNAWNAARDHDIVEMYVKAEKVPSPSAAFDEIVVLDIWNSGPPIESRIAKYVFMNGFTYRSAPSDDAMTRNYGRGLAVARGQLFLNGGDLQLADPGPCRHPADPDKTMGPRFVLTFGLTNRETERGSHEQVVGRRGHPTRAAADCPGGD